MAAKDNYYPAFDQFKKLSKKGNLIPVYREIFADMETPVSAFKKLTGLEVIITFIWSTRVIFY